MPRLMTLHLCTSAVLCIAKNKYRTFYSILQPRLLTLRGQKSSDFYDKSCRSAQIYAQLLRINQAVWRSSGSSSSTLPGNCIPFRQLLQLVLVCRFRHTPWLLLAGNPSKNLRRRDGTSGSRLRAWPTPYPVHHWRLHLHPGKIIPT